MSAFLTRPTATWRLVVHSPIHIPKKAGFIGCVDLRMQGLKGGVEEGFGVSRLRAWRDPGALEIGGLSACYRAGEEAMETCSPSISPSK